MSGERHTVHRAHRILRLAQRAQECHDRGQPYDGPKLPPVDQWPWSAEKDKSNTLSLLLAITALGGAPQDGRPRKHVSPGISLSQLAAVLNYRSISTVVRLIRASIPVFTIRRRRGAFNRYFLALPESATFQWKSPTDYAAASASELAQHPHWGRWWKRRGGRGYDPLIGWLYHPGAPCSANAKKVMAYWCYRGLQTLVNGRVTPGWVNPPIAAVAEATGLSLTCVRAQYHFWHGTGLVQIVPTKGHKDLRTGKWEQAPFKVVWLPGRIFDQDQADMERARLHIMKHFLRRSPWHGWIERIHEEVLKEWTGTRNTPRGFFSECWHRLVKAGVPEWAIKPLIPRARAPGPVAASA